MRIKLPDPARAAADQLRKAFAIISFDPLSYFSLGASMVLLNRAMEQETATAPTYPLPRSAVV